MTGQSKRQSLVETCSNTATGFMGSLLITWACMTYSPFSTEGTSLLIVALCTAWSLVRGYYVRRIFNGLANKREVSTE